MYLYIFTCLNFKIDLKELMISDFSIFMNLKRFNLIFFNFNQYE